MNKDKYSAYPHVLPDIEDWPIYRLSEDRRAFVEEIDQFTFERLMQQAPQQVLSMLAKTIYLERIRVKEEPWKVDPPNERQFWNRMSKKLVRKSLDRTQPEAERGNREILQQIISRYSEEIVGTFKIQPFLFARRFLTFFFTRLLNTAAGRSLASVWGSKYQLRDRLVVEGFVDEVRSLMTKGTVVIVPTHFSNLDSILIGFVLDTYVGLPSFSYGAGLNLYNTGYTAYFMNRLGAYRVDRRKKNPIYLETLKAMSNLSIQRGVNSLFFPGGTRARSGSLETHLKLGLLSTAVEAQRALYQRGSDEKVFIVPLVLSYPFVLEAQFLIEQHLRQMGKEQYIRFKDSSLSIRSTLKFIWGIFSKGNEITLSMGQPMDVIGNRVDQNGVSYDHTGHTVQVREYFMTGDVVNKDLQRESEYTVQLSERIVERYHRDNIVLSSHLVSFAAFELLRRQNKQLDLYGLLRLPADDYRFNHSALLEVLDQLRSILLKMEAQQEIRLSEPIRGDLQSLLDHGIARLGNFHVEKPLRYSRSGDIVSENFNLLYYYHNRLSTYGFDHQLTITSDQLLTELVE